MNTKNASAKKPAWAADDIAIKVVKTGTLSYERLTMVVGARDFQHQPATLLYDALALSYNQAEPGDLLMVALPNRPSTSNLRKILEARGVKECDYRLFRPAYDENGQRYPNQNRPLVLQRITDRVMRIIQPFPAMAKNMAKEAEQRGIRYSFMQSETPVIAASGDFFQAGDQDLAST